MDLLERPIAVTDTETTGLDPHRHEIIEIGLVLLDPVTLDPILEYQSKIKPEHPERIDPMAAKVNGYTEEGWKNAPPLSSVMHAYGMHARESVFTSQNPTFDWPFVRRAFILSKLKFLMEQMDYHRLDTFTMAWTLLRGSSLQKFSLETVAKHLGVPAEPKPHRAINGARCAALVLKRLMQMAE
jgi:DNA polymerase-3 subunit epsilon